MSDLPANHQNDSSKCQIHQIQTENSTSFSGPKSQLGFVKPYQSNFHIRQVGVIKPLSRESDSPSTFVKQQQQQQHHQQQHQQQQPIVSSMNQINLREKTRSISDNNSKEKEIIITKEEEEERSELSSSSSSLIEEKKSVAVAAVVVADKTIQLPVAPRTTTIGLLKNSEKIENSEKSQNTMSGLSSPVEPKPPVPAVRSVLGVSNRTTARSLSDDTNEKTVIKDDQKSSKSENVLFREVALKSSSRTPINEKFPPTEPQPLLSLKSRVRKTSAPVQPSNSMVFNFVNSNKDVTHIENDGLDMSKRRIKIAKVGQKYVHP